MGKIKKINLLKATLTPQITSLTADQINTILPYINVYRANHSAPLQCLMITILLKHHKHGLIIY